MSCVQLRRLIPLHAGGDLDEPLELAFAHHLRTCTSCPGHVSDYAAQQELLRSYGREGEAGSPDLWKDLRGRLGRPSWERRWPRRDTGR